MNYDDLIARVRRTTGEQELESRLERAPTAPFVRILPPATGTSIVDVTRWSRAMRVMRRALPWSKS